MDYQTVKVIKGEPLKDGRVIESRCGCGGVDSDSYPLTSAANPSDSLASTVSMPPSKPTEKYFDVEYQLDGESKWRQGITLSTDKTSALQNFLVDYAPCMGAITGIRIHQS